MALYDWKDILAEYYRKPIGIEANGPSIVAHQSVGAKFVGVPGADAENIMVHTTDFKTFPHPVWAVNGGWFYHPEKCTLGWNMDDMKADCMREHPQPEWYYSLFEGEKGIPIFTAKEYPEWPRCVAFPLKEALLATKMAYFTETLQYMLAFCYMAQVSVIHCYGMDYMNTDRQPGQRANTEWWLGFLHHAGIVCKISPLSNLMKAPVIEPFRTGFYGYMDNEPLPCDLEDINKRIRAGETWVYQPEN